MNNWGFNSNEYKRIIGNFSNRKHLIVEGSTDKRYFKILLDEFSQQTKQSNQVKRIDINDIDIDDLETFIKNNETLNYFGNDIVGNRQKVESIHKSVKDSPKYNNLVFFVDREFREFIIDDIIQDNLKKHKVEGSLIWSRGHSIENYLFDFTVLYQPLRRLTHIDLFPNIINIFKVNFYRIICLAIAISITLKECEKIQEELENTIDWELIDVSVLDVNLRIEDWKTRLCQRKKKNIRLEDIEKIILTYKKWYEKIKKSDYDIDTDTLRWVCHGHIGIQIIWEVYRSCIHCCAKKIGDINLNNESEIQKLIQEINKKINKIKKEHIWEEFASWWANKAVRDECCYPVEVLEKLGFK